MMQATDLRDLDGLPLFRALHGVALGAVHVQGQVSAPSVVVGDVAAEKASGVRFSEHDDVIQTFPPDAADQPLREGIAPRAARGKLPSEGV